MIPKFRAWLKNDKKMIDVDEIHFDNGQLDFIGDAITFMREADEIELMQSTGLFDKNGQEIFEGDVVTNGWKRQVVIFGTQEVEEDFGSIRIYRGFNLYLGGGYPNAIMSEFEVVGNIYENPDLLEADNDRD
jgi:uncharacterized phage protein (TIGR01671 family)